VIPSIATDITVAWSVLLYVSSVTIAFSAKAVGHNVMPFHRSVPRVVPSNTVLDRGPQSPWEREILESPVCSNATYHQITLALVLLRHGFC